jgi:diguanylate cyclase (GGDEF)-like protein/PAS domain S-box-containing protein
MLSVALLLAALALAGTCLVVVRTRGAADTERAAAAERARLRQLAAAAFEGLLFHRDGTVLDANAAMETLLGRSRDMIVGHPVSEFVVPDYADLTRRALCASAAGSIEVEILQPDTSRLPVELLWREVSYDGAPAVAVSARDLTARRIAADRHDFLAHHDGLTGLPNRLLFDDRLSQALEMAARTGEGVAVMCLDLDGFRQMNEHMGHQAADQLLIQVANRLTANLRAIDTVARLGADEFGVVQPLVAQPEAAANLARRLVACVCQPYVIAGNDVQIKASCGIALYPSDATASAGILRNAYTALYYAKHDGRGAWRFFEPGMDQILQQRLSLEQDLRGALERHELDLHYQPYFDCATNTLVGYEALLRWNHATLGKLLPGEFLPLAEQSGLIEQLGRWTLETACREAAMAGGLFRMAVNVSPTQFRQPGFAELVAATLVATGLPAHRLELEVTENLLLDRPNDAQAAVAALHALGVRICLDDFGTGFSSLSHLRMFPFDKIKIDRTYIAALDGSAQPKALVRAVIDLARGLGMLACAEGVETSAQEETLRGLQCHQLQGYLFARPMKALDAEELLVRAPALVSK